jgi:hypothetical protein
MNCCGSAKWKLGESIRFLERKVTLESELNGDLIAGAWMGMLRKKKVDVLVTGVMMQACDGCRWSLTIERRLQS